MKYAVLDTETGGLNPSIHPLIEVGYVLENGENYAFSLPFSVADCDERALEVNGWGKRDFAPLMSSRDACDLLMETLSDRLIVSSPSFFDMGFMEHLWRKTYPNAKPPWNHRAIVDLKSYACGVFGELKPRGNSDLAEVLGIEDTSDHTALGDAFYTRDLFEALIRYNKTYR